MDVFHDGDRALPSIADPGFGRRSGLAVFAVGRHSPHRGRLLGYGHLLLWQWDLGRGMPSALNPLMLLTQPTVLYFTAFIFLARSFATPLGGPVRTVYRMVGLIALAPIIVFFVFFPLLYLL